MPIMAEENKEKLLEVEEVRQRIAELKRKVGAENLTLDHVIPVARGGRSTRGNCVPCCKACNNEKKALTPAEQILGQLFPEGV